MIFLITALAIFVVGGLALGYYMGWGSNYNEPIIGGMVIGLTLIITLVLVGLSTIPSGPADGCYRIGSTSGSGVGVGVGSNGSVTVVPVSYSGRTYTPIACP